MSTLQQLMARRQALEQQQVDLARQIEAAHDAQRDEAIQNVKSLMQDHGLTIDDVLGSPAHSGGRAAGGGAKVAPKYRDPITGTTWTGRGLQPRWMRSALASGKTPADFLI
ncbi:MAG: H-NS histone family protein [Burkholderiales bacterium]|nr:H-NS histone family protein [Burkholderiales bacterium]